MPIKIQRFIGVFFILSCHFSLLLAQSNNECSGALLIEDPTNFCSAPNAANNLFATPSSVPVPDCFSNADHDVWFSFVAQAPNATITINNNSPTFQGNIFIPEVALYAGSCDDLTLLGCDIDSNSLGVAELRVEGLAPGESYFFRVDGTTVPGSFQYCVRNYFYNGYVSGDCPTAIVLCDKSSFNVQAVLGAGNIPTELDDVPCFGGNFAESSSTWYVFTAANSGTLEFTLTPNFAWDDLDFVVFSLPNGIGDCTNKVVERCMAAGDFNPDSPCMGPTGLNDTSTDISHSAGCVDILDDNFLKFLEVQEGNTYALAVNNFTSSNHGFQVDWGGTVEFAGPEAAIATDQVSDTICARDMIQFMDASTINQSTITDWKWTFGTNAMPMTDSTAIPGTVVYDSLGQQTVTLTITSSGGCEVSATKQIFVKDCPDEFYVPNAFTPNGDQINDRFKPALLTGTLINLQVWSRWGELVYEGNSPQGWDGNFDGIPAPSDVYVFQILVRRPDGTEEKRHGDITLIR